MKIKEQKEIIKQLKSAGITSVDEYTPFPNPYCVNPSNVKAIYLGCDPTNTKFKNRFEYAFALPDGEEYGFGRFVASHQSNLREVGLDWDTVYVQNLCQNYFTKETSKNIPDWKKATKIWIPTLKKELKDFSRNIPVLLTSELLYKVLLNAGVKLKKAIEFYDCIKGATVPIPSEENKLGRPLIPFYRHPKYHFSKGKWPEYKRLIRRLVK